MLALFLAVLGAKFRLVEDYGSDLPYWDQWDAEADLLIRPLLDGNLKAAAFVAPHNEHRILFTRLEALGLFLVNQRQWDARLEMVANALIHAGILAAIAVFILEQLPGLLGFAFVAVTALLYTNCASYENTLGGFQSQFYFLILFTGLHFAGTFLARPGTLIWRLAPLAGVAALFSMGSGFASSAVVLVLLLARILVGRRLAVGDRYVFFCNAAVLALGIALSTAPTEDGLKAASAGGVLASWWHQLAWPVAAPWAAWLNLMPGLTFAVLWLVRRIDTRPAAFLVALNAWYWLQEAAIAYGRGSVEIGEQYSSRYIDIAALGVLSALVSAAYLATQMRSAKAVMCGIAAMALAAFALDGVRRQADKTWDEAIVAFPAINQARIASVRDYVASRNPSFFQRKPWSELPYPSAQRLAGLLDCPEINRSLPASVRPPIALKPDPSATAGFAPLVSFDSARPAPAGLSAWVSNPNSATDPHFVSQPFAADHSGVSLFISTRATADQLHFSLIDQKNEPHEPEDRSYAPSDHWKRVNFKVPRGVYRLEVAASGRSEIAFTQLWTEAPLSSWARHLLGLASCLIYMSIGLGVLSFALIAASKPGQGARKLSPLAR